MPQHDRLPVRRSRFDDTVTRLDNAGARRHRRQFDDDDEPPARQRTPNPPPPDDDPIDGDRWSTWDIGQHGPTPRPDWLVTELAAVDTELGVLKTGKEAEVHLVERAVPGTSRSCLLAAKRYRTAEHRMFHRDAAYLEGRRVRRSRETRAMARRTAFGRDLLSGQWAAAEFSALCRLWHLGAPVPYPVQLHGTELLLEYLDEQDGQAAPGWPSCNLNPRRCASSGISSHHRQPAGAGVPGPGRADRDRLVHRDGSGSRAHAVMLGASGRLNAVMGQARRRSGPPVDKP